MRGVKEGLVEHVTDWPGIHAARYLVHGESLEGCWFNRSKEWAAANRGETYNTYDFATRYSIPFTQLPSFRHLSPEDYQDKVAGLIHQIEVEAEKKRDGDDVAGVEKILSQTPLEPPTRRTKRSPRPLFHAASKEARRDFLAGFFGFQTQYRIASDALRSGNLQAAAWFPAGSFPPALPIIGSTPPKRPPSPPTLRIAILKSGEVERGVIPMIEIPLAVDARARGQPP